MAKSPSVRKEFTTKTKALAFQRANGRCEECGARLTVGKTEYDHRIPDGLTGEPTLSNCACVCQQCHRAKTKQDVGRIAKAKRMFTRHIGAKKSNNPLPGGKGSKLKRKLSGQVVPR